ncbi:MAG TPA: hypothetical protein DCG32_06995 [Sphaerochaeta sp.]|jgi:hypothetical protein|nr:hypothetical protein [Sphaerochaeta sp.]
MKKERLTVTIFFLILLLGISSLPARDNNIAVGFQAGFATTGVVVDIGVGPIYLNAGINYPLGYNAFRAANNEGAGQDAFPKVATFSFDVSTAFPKGENFDLKLGLGGIVLTDFGSVAGGLVGPVLKGEYWIPNKNYALFLTINMPVMIFGVLIGDIGGDSSDAVDFDPMLYTMFSLLTTSVGVLYSF